MKKTYIAPEMEEIKINDMNLLAGSMGVEATIGGDPISSGGGDTGGTLDPDAPELPGMPDMSPEELLGFPF